MVFLKFLTNDGNIIKVADDIVRISKTIDVMLSDLDIYNKKPVEEEEEDTKDQIPLYFINSTIFKKVIEWCEHKKRNKNNTDYLSDDLDFTKWEIKFLDLDDDTLIDLINAANYLDIEGLLNITCKKAASMINTKTSDEIRRLFGIDNSDICSNKDVRLIKNKQY